MDRAILSLLSISLLNLLSLLPLRSLQWLLDSFVLNSLGKYPSHFALHNKLLMKINFLLPISLSLSLPFSRHPVPLCFSLSSLFPFSLTQGFFLHFKFFFADFSALKSVIFKIFSILLQIVFSLVVNKTHYTHIHNNRV